MRRPLTISDVQRATNSKDERLARSVGALVAAFAPFLLDRARSEARERNARMSPELAIQYGIAFGIQIAVLSRMERNDVFALEREITAQA